MFKAMECLCLLSGYWADPQYSWGLERKGTPMRLDSKMLMQILKRGVGSDRRPWEGSFQELGERR